MTDDIHDLAERNIARAEYIHMKRWLRITSKPRGGMLALCGICPNKTFDTRGGGNRAFSSGYSSDDPDEIREWWRAHVATEMHEWYVSAPRHPADPQDVENARIWGAPIPKPIPEPFKYAKRHK